MLTLDTKLMAIDENQGGSSTAMKYIYKVQIYTIAVQGSKVLILQYRGMVVNLYMNYDMCQQEKVCITFWDVEQHL